MAVIGIVGSRRRNTMEDMRKCIETLKTIFKEGDTFVSGGCPKGGDSFAEIIANTMKVPIKIHKAEWDKYGKGAGYKRNTYIAEDSDILIAVVAFDRTGGTEDTIRKYQKMGKEKLILV